MALREEVDFLEKGQAKFFLYTEAAKFCEFLMFKEIPFVVRYDGDYVVLTDIRDDGK